MNPSALPQILKQPKPTINSQNYITPLKHPKIHPILLTQTKWRCLIDSDITSINKYKPKMLSIVELKGLRFQEITVARKLCKALADAKRISSLIIDPEHNSYNFTKLGDLLRTTNRWKKLTIKYVNNQDGQDGSSNKEKFKSMTRLGRCTDLSSLNLSFNCLSQTERKLLKSLSHQLQGLPKLKALSIDVTACYLNGDSDDEQDYDENKDKYDSINSPLLKFKYPRSLLSLHLNFYEDCSMNAQLLPIFSSNIQQCRRLDHISLNLNNIIHHMETSEAQIWACLAEKRPSVKTLAIRKTLHNHESEANEAYLDSFQHLNTLENFDISFYFSLSDQSNQILTDIFYTHFASFTNLKSLDLTFSCHKKHPAFLNLSILKSFSGLEKLRLNLMYCLNIDNQFLQDLAETLPSLCYLQSLELIPPNLGITSEGIVAFSSSFKQLSCLRKLSLNFWYVNINHKSMEIFCNNLAHLNLTSLKIFLGEQSDKPDSFLQKISAWWEPDKRLTFLFSALCGFKALQNLSLSLSGYDICNKEFEHFSLALKELSQLKSLYLELPQFDSANNFAGLRKLLSSIKELQRLDSLHLNFKGAKLCNKEVELVGLNLRDFNQSIQDLGLLFEHAENLGNEALGAITLGLQGFLSLKDLLLVIGNQKIFQEEIVAGLLKTLATLKELESISLGFRSSALCKEVGMIVRKKEIQQNLRKLTRYLFHGMVWI